MGTTGSCTPKFKFALGHLEFHVAVHSGWFSSPSEDRIVSLAFSSGRLEVRHHTNRRAKTNGAVVTIPAADICVPGKRISYKVAENANTARGVYLIARASTAKEVPHVGKLVRRICQIVNDECTLYYGTGVYLCQRVCLTRIPGLGDRYFENLEEEPLFNVHYSNILEVHCSRDVTKRGNQLVYDTLQSPTLPTLLRLNYPTQSYTLEGQDPGDIPAWDSQELGIPMTGNSKVGFPR